MTPRPYQVRATEDLRAAYAVGYRAPLFVAPTGAGKTCIFSNVSYGAIKKGNRVLILAHRRELVRQASEKLTAAGVEHGIIAAGFSGSRDQVKVASVQTLARRLESARDFDLIVVDEAHHAVSNAYTSIIAENPKARVLGVTATPERLDGRGLRVVFDTIVLGPTIPELIAGGYLVRSRVFAPTCGLDVSAARVSGGDYVPSSLERIMDTPTITGDAVAHYARHAPGLPAIAFCATVQHAKDVAAAFSRAGWRAASADGSTDARNRDDAIGGLVTGAVQVLACCDLVSEGLDVPAVGAVILLRPTKSLCLHVQQIGRGLRPSPGKDKLVVLDHAGNVLRHGMPDAVHRWSLDGRGKKPRKAPAVAQCPQCYALHSPSRKCPSCGFDYGQRETENARTVETVAGELTEVDAERVASLRQGKLADVLGREHPKTLRDYQEIGRARGYARGWAWMQMQESRKHRVA